MKITLRALAAVIVAVFMSSFALVYAHDNTTDIFNERYSLSIPGYYGEMENAPYDIYSGDNRIFVVRCYNNPEKLRISKMTDESMNEYYKNYGDKIDSKVSSVSKGIANGYNYMRCCLELKSGNIEAYISYYTFATENYVYEIKLTCSGDFLKNDSELKACLETISFNDTHYEEDVEQYPEGKSAPDFTGAPACKVYDFETERPSDIISDTIGGAAGEVADKLVNDGEFVGSIVSIVFIVFTIITFVVVGVALCIMIVFIRKYSKAKKELKSLKEMYPVNGGYNANQNGFYSPNNGGNTSPGINYNPNYTANAYNNPNPQYNPYYNNTGAPYNHETSTQNAESAPEQPSNDESGESENKNSAAGADTE